MAIIDSFPGTPRAAQKHVLTELEKLWNDHDVFVIDAPTAAGKSFIAATITRWAECGAIITPNNLLVEQYEDIPDLGVLWARARYCSEQQFLDSRDRASYAPTAMNYYTYMSNRLYQPILIADEAHGLVPFLTGLQAIHFSPKSVGIYDSDPASNTIHLQSLLDQVDPKEHPERVQKKIKKIKKVLNAKSTSHLIRWNEEHEQYDFLPVTPKAANPILWPAYYVKKLILMSATINPTDIHELGLDRKKVAYIFTPSPIAPERRPVVSVGVGTLGHGGKGIEAVAEWLQGASANLKGKGIVHATYEWAARLRARLGDDPRFLWHDKESKHLVLYNWEKSDGEEILIASGMEEGIDLAFDKARWQAIAKVNYPSIADPAIYHKFREDPTWWKWQAIRNVLQAAGRVCRDPEDYGITFILDSSFNRLYDENEELFPQWFKDALEFT